MKTFNIETGIVIPIDRSNVDTDAILPKQFLKSIKRTGFGVSLFEEWRYLDPWYVDIDYNTRPLNMDCVLNFTQYQKASVLIARDNFGCGSSREHAVWALDGYGIRTVIATSFGDIFFNNCFKNGVLAIQLPATEINEIFGFIAENEKDRNSNVDKPALSITTDLSAQTINISNQKYYFEIDQFRKDCLLKGLDEIAITLKNAQKIKDFEKKHQQKHPWVFTNLEKPID